MKNRPFYHKLYADMIRDKYPDKEQKCTRYLKKENWTALDVIQVNTLLSENQPQREQVTSDRRHRAYDQESIREILRYQKVNNLNNSQLSKKYCLSRNTVARWRRLFEEDI